MILQILHSFHKKQTGQSKPEEYLENIEENRLEAQLVPLNEELWKVDRYRDFLVERRGLITQAINEYMREIGAGYFDVSPDSV